MPTCERSISYAVTSSAVANSIGGMVGPMKHKPASNFDRIGVFAGKFSRHDVERDANALLIDAHGMRAVEKISRHQYHAATLGRDGPRPPAMSGGHAV